ncbi:PGL/p-HBAD biosynthesis glycosyltransferase/MT3031 [Vibrio quintilis]|uniref:PGL/p-HBAD biosynthesis glycosyltransferase/MT3031 n=1 Tax=Vibrio quintilis TaxID=1117707 RepID=A0A1M7Z388_9VIBR|nr:PGL/p-HBAD biosynthesis glycosyltransferase/MT3031 [Vibrio quintilis]
MQNSKLTKQVSVCGDRRFLWGRFLWGQTLLFCRFLQGQARENSMNTQTFITESQGSDRAAGKRTRSALSLIVPMLNEAQQLPDLLPHLQVWQANGHEVLLVDGGSEDTSVSLALSAGFRVLHSERGRAKQMNTGAAIASGNILVFLHADTRLPALADQMIIQGLRRQVWGRFDVHLTGQARMLSIVAALMNLRSRLTGIATGDQTMFVDRDVFRAAGGFPEQPLMEDIEMSKRLLRFGRPCCLKVRATTSGRRWQERGVWRTIWLMWRLRWAYWQGVPAEQLAKEYR